MRSGNETSSPLIRVGIPASFPRFSAACHEVGAAVLVSANGLRKDGKFRKPKPNLFNGCDVALDSAGFVAMVRYKGYPWSVADYIRLAGSFPWTWYAAMDFCCEREVAGDRTTVLQRVRATAEQLEACRREAQEQGIAEPMPVLQGWLPDDYLRCVELMAGELPALVGLGSVCRRPLGGEDGLARIIARLDARLPRHVRLHLFGVKGDAIAAFTGHPRIASVDSMAWDFAARRELPKEGRPYSVANRIEKMRTWYHAQIAAASPWRLAV